MENLDYYGCVHCKQMHFPTALYSVVGIIFTNVVDIHLFKLILIKHA